MKIIKSSEPIVISQMKVQIFGAPGTGKTSFALTAEAPLLLDFDRGAHRAIHKSDRLEINAWSDVMELLDKPNELVGYKTLVCDTVGKQLDMLTVHLINENGRLAQGSGALTQTGYGARKVAYYAFLQRAAMLGLDIVLVSHDREKDIDEITKVRPDVSGGTYSDIMKEMDLCGYIDIIKGKRTIDFNPSERSIGKNCAGFPQMELTPQLTMGHLISEAKKITNKRNEASAEMVAEIEAWKTKIEGVTDSDTAMAIVAEGRKVTSDTVKAQLLKLLSTKTLALGLKYDKDKASYVPNEPVTA